MRRIFRPLFINIMRIDGYTIKPIRIFRSKSGQLLLVPLNYTVGNDGRLKIYALRKHPDLAENSRKWAKNCFDDACFDWIYDRFEPIITSWGYETDIRRIYLAP